MASVPVARQEVYEMEVESGFHPKSADMMAWGASVGVHIVAILLLGLIHYEVMSSSNTILDSTLQEIVEDGTPLFSPTAADQIGTAGDLNSQMASQSAASNIARQDIESVVQQETSTAVEQPVVVLQGSGSIPQVPKEDYGQMIQTRGTTEHAGGVEGAVDRLAWEISNSLREGKTLVVWMFDVSPSLAQRREIIADRVENVYNQLTQLNVDADKALLSTVVAFSDKFRFVTPEPLSDSASVVKAVRDIKSEASGDENVFSAVFAAANKWLIYRQKMHRKMMMVIVTDEAGSDEEQMMEKAIALTKRYGIRCYVVGDAAPFGKAVTETPFTLESGEEVIGIMHNGPEGKFPDLVKLPYWGINSGDLDHMSSGFGPYGLTRLAAETNGLYLVSKETSRHRFDPQIMRNYAPDYRPIPILQADVGKNKAKVALLECANYTKELNLPVPRLEFPAENDTVLRQAIAESQKPVADFDYRLQELQNRIEVGEKDRSKIGDARWQAAYDLAMGRILALRARTYGYNLMLAEMRVNPKKFDKQGSNRWRLVPSSNVNSGQAVKKMAAKASEYLNRVIDQHAGTPWQIMAEREKSAPLGWEWKEETYTPPPPNAMGDGNGKKGPKIIEETDPKTGKKVKRQLPAQPVKREI